MPWEPAYCSSRSAEYRRLMWQQNGGSLKLKSILFYGPEEEKGEDGPKHCICSVFQTLRLAGLAALSPPKGWSHIQIPGTIS